MEIQGITVKGRFGEVRNTNPELTVVFDHGYPEGDGRNTLLSAVVARGPERGWSFEWNWEFAERDGSGWPVHGTGRSHLEAKLRFSTYRHEAQNIRSLAEYCAEALGIAETVAADIETLWLIQTDTEPKVKAAGLFYRLDYGQVKVGIPDLPEYLWQTFPLNAYLKDVDWVAVKTACEKAMAEHRAVAEKQRTERQEEQHRERTIAAKAAKATRANNVGFDRLRDEAVAWNVERGVPVPPQLRTAKVPDDDRIHLLKHGAMVSGGPTSCDLNGANYYTEPNLKVTCPDCIREMMNQGWL